MHRPATSRPTTSAGARDGKRAGGLGTGSMQNRPQSSGHTTRGGGMPSGSVSSSGLQHLPFPKVPRRLQEEEPKPISEFQRMTSFASAPTMSPEQDADVAAFFDAPLEGSVDKDFLLTPQQNTHTPLANSAQQLRHGTASGRGPQKLNRESSGLFMSTHLAPHHVIINKVGESYTQENAIASMGNLQKLFTMKGHDENTANIVETGDPWFDPALQQLAPWTADEIRQAQPQPPAGSAARAARAAAMVKSGIVARPSSAAIPGSRTPSLEISGKRRAVSVLGFGRQNADARPTSAPNSQPRQSLGLYQSGGHTAVATNVLSNVQSKSDRKTPVEVRKGTLKRSGNEKKTSRKIVKGPLSTAESPPRQRRHLEGSAHTAIAAAAESEWVISSQFGARPPATRAGGGPGIPYIYGRDLSPASLLRSQDSLTQHRADSDQQATATLLSVGEQSSAASGAVYLPTVGHLPMSPPSVAQSPAAAIADSSHPSPSQHDSDSALHPATLPCERKGSAQRASLGVLCATNVPVTGGVVGAVAKETTVVTQAHTQAGTQEISKSSPRQRARSDTEANHTVVSVSGGTQPQPQQHWQQKPIRQKPAPARPSTAPSKSAASRNGGQQTTVIRVKSATVQRPALKKTTYVDPAAAMVTTPAALPLMGLGQLSPSGCTEDDRSLPLTNAASGTINNNSNDNTEQMPVDRDEAPPLTTPQAQLPTPPQVPLPAPPLTPPSYATKNMGVVVGIKSSTVSLAMLEPRDTNQTGEKSPLVSRSPVSRSPVMRASRPMSPEPPSPQSVDHDLTVVYGLYSRYRNEEDGIQWQIPDSSTGGGGIDGDGGHGAHGGHIFAQMLMRGHDDDNVGNDVGAPWSPSSTSDALHGDADDDDQHHGDLVNRHSLNGFERAALVNMEEPPVMDAMESAANRLLQRQLNRERPPERPTDLVVSKGPYLPGTGWPALERESLSVPTRHSTLDEKGANVGSDSTGSAAERRDGAGSSHGAIDSRTTYTRADPVPPPPSSQATLGASQSASTCVDGVHSGVESQSGGQQNTPASEGRRKAKLWTDRGSVAHAARAAIAAASLPRRSRPVLDTHVSSFPRQDQKLEQALLSDDDIDDIADDGKYGYYSGEGIAGIDTEHEDWQQQGDLQIPLDGLGVSAGVGMASAVRDPHMTHRLRNRVHVATTDGTASGLPQKRYEFAPAGPVPTTRVRVFQKTWKDLVAMSMGATDKSNKFALEKEAVQHQNAFLRRWTLSRPPIDFGKAKTGEDRVDIKADVLSQQSMRFATRWAVFEPGDGAIHDDGQPLVEAAANANAAAAAALAEAAKRPGPSEEALCDSPEPKSPSKKPREAYLQRQQSLSHYTEGGKFDPMARKSLKSTPAHSPTTQRGSPGSKFVGDDSVSDDSAYLNDPPSSVSKDLAEIGLLRLSRGQGTMSMLKLSDDADELMKNQTELLERNAKLMDEAQRMLDVELIIPTGGMHITTDWPETAGGVKTSDSHDWDNDIATPNNVDQTPRTPSNELQSQQCLVDLVVDPSTLTLSPSLWPNRDLPLGTLVEHEEIDLVPSYKPVRYTAPSRSPRKLGGQAEAEQAVDGHAAALEQATNGTHGENMSMPLEDVIATDGATDREVSEHVVATPHHLMDVRVPSPPPVSVALLSRMDSQLSLTAGTPPGLDSPVWTVTPTSKLIPSHLSPERNVGAPVNAMGLQMVSGHAVAEDNIGEKSPTNDGGFGASPSMDVTRALFERSSGVQQVRAISAAGAFGSISDDERAETSLQELHLPPAATDEPLRRTIGDDSLNVVTRGDGADHVSPEVTNARGELMSIEQDQQQRPLAPATATAEDTELDQRPLMSEKAQTILSQELRRTRWSRPAAIVPRMRKPKLAQKHQLFPVMRSLPPSTRPNSATKGTVTKVMPI